jgi:hypothetical protein
VSLDGGRIQRSVVFHHELNYRTELETFGGPWLELFGGHAVMSMIKKQGEYTNGEDYLPWVSSMYTLCQSEGV